MNDISIAILSSYYGHAFDIPNFDQKAVELSKKELVKYEGFFSTDATPLKINVKVINGQLTAQATGQRTLTLTLYSSIEFRFDLAGIVMFFATNGRVINYSTFQLKQGGGNFKFTRK